MTNNSAWIESDAGKGPTSTKKAKRGSPVAPEALKCVSERNSAYDPSVRDVYGNKGERYFKANNIPDVASGLRPSVITVEADGTGALPAGVPMQVYTPPQLGQPVLLREETSSTGRTTSLWRDANGQTYFTYSGQGVMSGMNAEDVKETLRKTRHSSLYAEESARLASQRPDLHPDRAAVVVRRKERRCKLRQQIARARAEREKIRRTRAEQQEFRQNARIAGQAEREELYGRQIPQRQVHFTAPHEYIRPDGTVIHKGQRICKKEYIRIFERSDKTPTLIEQRAAAEAAMKRGGDRSTGKSTLPKAKSVVKCDGCGKMITFVGKQGLAYEVKAGITSRIHLCERDSDQNYGSLGVQGGLPFNDRRKH